MSQSEWRLMHTPPLAGPLNMALDEAILESVLAQQAAPTLRFYAWDPACLSIGYAQPVADVDPAALEREGWELVRRPTGGKAILHTDEITYSISAPDDLPLFLHGVLPSYERISRALIDGLQGLGLQPELQEVGSAVPQDGNPVCFQNPGAFEITFEGRKLVGSAQLRRRGGVLQHGSVPIRGDIGRICLGLNYPSRAQRQRAAAEVSLHAITIEGVLGDAPSWEIIAAELTAGFEHALELRFMRADPSPLELTRADEILGERYMNPTWTGRT